MPARWRGLIEHDRWLTRDELIEAKVLEIYARNGWAKALTQAQEELLDRWRAQEASRDDTDR